MNTTNRRGFLKLTGLGILAASVSKLFSPTKAAAAGAELVNENDPLAKSLGYHADAKKVDSKKWPKHAGAEGAKQDCGNCMFYQSKDAKATEAPCQIFSGKHVKAAGWCNSWAKKA
jgi:hypothetical protein